VGRLPAQEPSFVERIEYPLSGRSGEYVAAVLWLSFPVQTALLVSIVITISVRSRVHNEYFLQKVTGGDAKGFVLNHPGQRVEHVFSGMKRSAE
jgi:hypothetical protein